MVHIVIVAPPADTDPSHKVRNGRPDDSVRHPISRQARVTSVMRDKGDLMPPSSKRDGSCDVSQRRFGDSVEVNEEEE